MSRELPLVGGAFDLAALQAHRDWILERQRDVELQQFIDPTVLIGDWRDLAARTKGLLRGHTGRLGLHGPFVGLTLDADDPEIRAVVQRRLAQALDVAAELAATQMVVHSPFKTWDHFNLDAVAGARRDFLRRAGETLLPVVRRAEALGVGLVIENIEDMDPRDRVELARSFASPAVGVSLDTGHAHYAHRATGGRPVDFHVRVAGDLLRHVHLQDSDGYADRHWVPGAGDVPWPAIFATLDELASPPRLILELKDRMRILEGAAWLARQGLAM